MEMKLRKNNIYLGTIKKCLDAYSFERYGESRYVGHFNKRKYSSDIKEKFAKTYEEKIYLLKGKKEIYIDINDINTFKDLLLFKLGKSKKAMKISPHEDNELYVEKNSLKQLFTDDKKFKKIKLKTLKETINKKL